MGREEDEMIETGYCQLWLLQFYLKRVLSPHPRGGTAKARPELSGVLHGLTRGSRMASRLRIQESRSSGGAALACRFM